MVQLRKNEEELAQETNKRKLLFPVIAWYGIIGNEKSPCLLLSRGFFM